MDDAWRFRAISDHTQLCPTCSISHYPFCNPPLGFTGDNLPCFPSDFRSDHYHLPFCNPSTSNGPAYVHPSSHPQPFPHEDVMNRESFRKRMRVEDPSIEVSPHLQPLSRGLSMDDERRLSLIRDHGRDVTTQVRDERHWSSDSGYQVDRDCYDVLQKHAGSDGSDRRSSEPEFHRRDGFYQSIVDFEWTDFEYNRRVLHDQQIVDGNSYGASAQLDRTSAEPSFIRSGEASGGSLNSAYGVPSEPFLKDSLSPASYFTNDDSAIRIGKVYDQNQASYTTKDFSTLRTGNFHDHHSALLPKHHSHSYSENYHMEPHYHEVATQNLMESKSKFHRQNGGVMRNCFDSITEDINNPFDYPQTYHTVGQLNPHISKNIGYTSAMANVNHAMATSMPNHGHASLAHIHVPSQPLFPIQNESALSSSSTISVASPVGANNFAKKQLSVHGSHSLLQGSFYRDSPLQKSNDFPEGSSFSNQPSLNLNVLEPSLAAMHSSNEKLVNVDAARLFKQPYRASRPDHIVIILRGLPGSGKSYLAKLIRDIEVENGGSVPRIHAMDDYFMIEVEKVEENDGFKSSGSVRSKKQSTKKVVEYCYEPEMEEAYRSSMLKALKKTLNDGSFTLVIVDDRNLRVADFAHFWAIAKRLGYEVYLLEATYKDPTGCAARNIHGFKLADVQKMAQQWEEAPSLYIRLDIQSLLGVDDLVNQSIQEVDMEADDILGEEAHLSQLTDDDNSTEIKHFDQESDHGSTKLGKRWNIEEEVFPAENELQKSKWSKNEFQKNAVGNTSALSGLIQAYGTGVKSVRWGDKIEASGFSLGGSKNQALSSLIIGSGAGYNLESNPLPEDNANRDATQKSPISNETKRQFLEQLRAERESFRAVFDRRRRRLGGLHNADDD